MLLLVIAYLAQFIYLDDDVAGRLHALFDLMPPSNYFTCRGFLFLFLVV